MAAEEARKLAEERFKLAVLSYEAGLGSHLDVSDASAQLSEAEAASQGALYAYKIGSLKLKYTVFP